LKEINCECIFLNTGESENTIALESSEFIDTSSAILTRRRSALVRVYLTSETLPTGRTLTHISAASTAAEHATRTAVFARLSETRVNLTIASSAVVADRTLAFVLVLVAI
jgi:hypothetical protein